MSIYRELVKKFAWTLKDIDETNLETLVDFLFFNSKADPNIRVINGKEYRRTAKAPAWL